MPVTLQSLGTIVLASQSQARLELLKSLKLNVIVRPTHSEETSTQTQPGNVVQELAFRKLTAYMESPDYNPRIPAVAADTLIWFENTLMGKAHSPEEARRQISRLSGNTHTVFSGFALYIDGKTYQGFDSTLVTFRKIGQPELDNYIAGGQWKGAAGSYRLDGQAGTFISCVQGSRNTVTGLPLERISDIIKTLRS